MLATLTGAVFVERVTVDTPKTVRNAKKAIRKAFEVQQAGLGFGIVEVLSTCTTNWGLAPVSYTHLFFIQFLIFNFKISWKYKDGTYIFSNINSIKCSFRFIVNKTDVYKRQLLFNTLCYY